MQCSPKKLYLLCTLVRAVWQVLAGPFWQGRTVHKGFDSNGMKRRRQTDFTKAGAVHKSKFLDFFNLCVGDINFLQQVTIVTGMCSYHCVGVSALIPVELRQPCASSLAVVCCGDPLGGESSRRTKSARFIQSRKRYCPNWVVLQNWLATPSVAYTRNCSPQRLYDQTSGSQVQ